MNCTSKFQECKHDHIGGDIHEKISPAAVQQMDTAYAKTMEELKFVLRFFGLTLLKQ